MISKKKLLSALKSVPDPELGVSIVDLGLVYNITSDAKGNVYVVMTLTSMGCPLFELIELPIKESLKKIKGVKNVSVELTFDPPWSVERMTKEAKVKMGFF